MTIQRRASSGDPGVELLGVDSGPEAYVVYAQEFSGIANVHASPVIGNPLPIVAPTVHAVAAGEHKLAVENTLLGALGGVGVVDLMTVEVHGPDWSNRGCYHHAQDVNTMIDVYQYCWFTALDGPDRAGPGEYSFRLQAKGSVGLADVIGLWAADVRLPA